MKLYLARKSHFFRYLLWVLFLVWVTLLIGLSVSPLSFKFKLHTVGPYHDFVHYFVYILTAILICQVVKKPAARLAGFVLAIAIAFGQEWLENQIYHAGFEWKDVGTDMAGIVSGFALVTLVSVLFGESDRSRSL